MRAGDDAERSDEEERRHGSDRVVITAAAAKLLGELMERHGPVMFHQSGGCCDGSSPMCYPDGEFIVGDRDVLVGLLDVKPGWVRGCRCGFPGRSLRRGSTPSSSSMWCRAAAAASAWKHRRACAFCPAAGRSATPKMR